MNVGDLGPNEEKAFDVESPIPVDQIKWAIFKTTYTCTGCNHSHETTTKAKNLARINISIQCPCCTPLWLKIINKCFRRGG